MEYGKLKVIISGGGTGGHIFPALSIADKLKEVCPETEILFVGAEGKMEMEKVPAAGYEITGLPVVGFQRQLKIGNLRNNIKIPAKVLSSLHKARAILKSFKPDIVVGVGGYASAPMLWSAQRMGVPTLIQEQNSFAGLTNRILGRKAGRICVAYEGMERFFPEKSIVMTGNPIRPVMHPYSAAERAEGLGFYGMHEGRRHLLVTGGSLGCATLNNAMKVWIENGKPGGEDIEVLWQCGRYYKKSIDGFMSEHNGDGSVQWCDFISRMDLAFAAADLVISRSGASAISEICATGKPAIFVPSPNVSEDHQTHNALALVNRNAAAMIRDRDAVSDLMSEAARLIHNESELDKLGANAAKMAMTSASQSIIDEIYKLIR